MNTIAKFIVQPVAVLMRYVCLCISCQDTVLYITWYQKQLGGCAEVELLVCVVRGFYRSEWL